MPPRELMWAMVSLSRRVMQSQRMFPAGVRMRAQRWPMANLGVVFVRWGMYLACSIFRRECLCVFACAYVDESYAVVFVVGDEDVLETASW